MTGVENLAPLLLREPDMLGNPVLDVAGLDRLTILEDLQDGKQEAIPGRHLARSPRNVTHAWQVIRAIEE